VLTSYVFRAALQPEHEDGVPREFLRGIAQSLHERQEMQLVGGGAKGNLPLVIRDEDTPYRAFL
jgi:hypothetical protein